MINAWWLLAAYGLGLMTPFVVYWVYTLFWPYLGR